MRTVVSKRDNNQKSQLESLGFLVFCLDAKEEVEVMLDAIQAT